MANISKRTKQITVTAVLSALIFVLAFTPLGYLKVGVLSITFLTIPVVIGAVTEGPGVGAILGAVFGLTSFMQCFGLDAIGTLLFGLHPLVTFLMCMIPRILVGLFAGLLFKHLNRVGVQRSVASTISFLTGALTNTVLFLSFFAFNCFLADYSSDDIWKILGGILSLNSLIEAVVCTVIGVAVSEVILKVYDSIH